MSVLLINIIFIIYSIIIYIYRENIGFFFKILDKPDNERKVHKGTIPAIGGLIIFPFLVINLFLSYDQGFANLKSFCLYFFFLSYFFYFGFLDDKFELNAQVKTIFIVGGLFIVLPLEPNFIIQYIENADLEKKILLNQASLLFTVFCVFFLYNSLNFSDGLNGVSISLSIYWILIIIFKNLNYDPFPISIFVALVITFIPNILNKIFLGNSGASLLSIIFALLYLESYNNKLIFFDEVVLIFFLPCLDTVRITFERIINNKSPLSGDQNHFHHLLAKIISFRYVFIPYIFFAAIPYVSTLLGLKTYYSFIFSIIIYYSILFYLKKIN